MTPTEKKEAKKNEDTAAVLSAIADMPESDRVMGERFHAVIMANAPDLLPRTWYGMPAYSDGNKIVCFFRSGKKFCERYVTFGFNDVAKLDDGAMWPITFALTKVGDAEEVRVAELIRRAVAAK